MALCVQVANTEKMRSYGIIEKPIEMNALLKIVQAYRNTDESDPLAKASL